MAPFDEYFNDWIVNYRDEVDFWAYLSVYFSQEELRLWFRHFKQVRCCKRHSGNCPVEADSLENTPSVSGVKCKQRTRLYLRHIRDAVVNQSIGPHLTERPELIAVCKQIQTNSFRRIASSC